MNHTLQHKDYTASVRFSEEDGCYVGEVLGLNHIICFDGKTIDEAYQRFKESIDDYPETCERLGVTPEAPGATLVLPLTKDLYTMTSEKANLLSQSVQEVITSTLEASFSPF